MGTGRGQLGNAGSTLLGRIQLPFDERLINIGWHVEKNSMTERTQLFWKELTRAETDFLAPKGKLEFQMTATRCTDRDYRHIDDIMDSAKGQLEVHIDRALLDNPYVTLGGGELHVSIEVGDMYVRTQSVQACEEPAWDRHFLLPIHDIFDYVTVTLTHTPPRRRSDVTQASPACLLASAFLCARLTHPSAAHDCWEARVSPHAAVLHIHRHAAPADACAPLQPAPSVATLISRWHPPQRLKDQYLNENASVGMHADLQLRIKFTHSLGPIEKLKLLIERPMPKMIRHHPSVTQVPAPPPLLLRPVRGRQPASGPGRRACQSDAEADEGAAQGGAEANRADQEGFAVGGGCSQGHRCHRVVHRRLLLPARVVLSLWCHPAPPTAP